MKTLIPVVCFTCLSLTMALAQDPVKADPAHYKVLLNNPHVRVLDVVIKKGEKTPMHSHPDYVIYALTNATVKFTLPDGKTNTATINKGETLWRKGETHAAENVGKTEAHVLNIELKK